MRQDKIMQVDEWYSSGINTEVLGRPVFYRRDGNNKTDNTDHQKNTLVCIHGFPTASWDFAELWPTLSERFDVIAHDMLGFGRSDKTRRDITVKLQADIIERLTIDLGISQAHILAHDLGDTVAQELLARQYDGSASVQWLSCVFLNGGIFPEAHRPRKVQKLLASPLGPLLARLISKRSYRKTMTTIFGPKYPPSDAFIEGTWQLTVENNGKQMLPVLIRYMQERRENRSRWVAPLENPKIPLKLINGVLDPVSGGHAAKRFRVVVPNADITLLDDAGHYPHVEKPVAVEQAFVEFHDGLIAE